MHEVRIVVKVGAVGLEFQGRRAFFERHIEPLVLAAYGHAGTAMPVTDMPVTDTGPVGIEPADGVSPEEICEDGGVGQAGPPAATSGANGHAEPVLHEATFQPSSPVQFNRFVGQVGARAADADQRIMAFAFYLWNFERRDDFDLDQIEAFFRTVQDNPPPDLSKRLVDLSGRRRFIEQAGEEDDAWRLTTKGVNYVKNRLLGPGLGATGS